MGGWRRGREGAKGFSKPRASRRGNTGGGKTCHMGRGGSGGPVGWEQSEVANAGGDGLMRGSPCDLANLPKHLP